MANATPYPLPDGTELVQELGFQGYVPPGVQHIQPIKRPKGGQLKPEQKASNQQVARRRVLMKHVISSVKRCRIIKHTIRLWNEKMVCATWPWRSAAGYTTFGSVLHPGHRLVLTDSDRKN
jgi:hypothetical protein